ncbi:hypothetical protein Tco_0242773 [Tanacetum coccineum]
MSYNDERLSSYGLQNYLPDNIAKPIIELSSLFKQLCSATLMEDDMLKASVKVVEILCELSAYILRFFGHYDSLAHPFSSKRPHEGGLFTQVDVYLEQIHEEAKGYVRNKAKPESLRCSEFSGSTLATMVGQETYLRTEWTQSSLMVITEVDALADIMMSWRKTMILAMMKPTSSDLADSWMCRPHHDDDGVEKVYSSEEED